MAAIVRGARIGLGFQRLTLAVTSAIMSHGVVATREIAVTTEPSCRLCRIELEPVRVLDGGVIPEIGQARALHR